MVTDGNPNPDDPHGPHDPHDPHDYGDPRDDPEPDETPAAEIAADLKPKQNEAILALLSQPTVTTAAKSVGIGERTLHRWMDEDPAFIAAYRAARRQVFGHAVALCQRYAAMAVQALAKVMTDTTAPHAAKVSAAAALLRFGREGIELEDLQDRIETLEARMTEQPDAFRRALP